MVLHCGHSWRGCTSPSSNSDVVCALAFWISLPRVRSVEFFLHPTGGWADCRHLTAFSEKLLCCSVICLPLFLHVALVVHTEGGMEWWSGPHALVVEPVIDVKCRFFSPHNRQRIDNNSDATDNATTTIHHTTTDQQQHHRQPHQLTPIDTNTQQHILAQTHDTPFQLWLCSWGFHEKC